MYSEPVEALQQQYTDKYVKVDARRPELARFADVVGQVKTVNMSGRALVEFLDYNSNIGWFDIDLSALTVVDKPTPSEKKEDAERKAPAAAGDKKLSPLEMARMQGGGGKAAGAPAGGMGKTSTADILAAARGGATAKTPATTTPAPSKPAEGGKPSTADILAAARGGGKPAAAAPPATPPAAAASPKPGPAAAQPAADPPAGGKIVRVDKSNMTVDEMIAYCREHDAQ